MAKLGQEKIKELISQMGHYDPDNMEMAAKRISELIIQGQINLQENNMVAHQIRQAFMKQIQSENDTVQSQAIKYLADIVPSLPSEQVELIYEKILTHITQINESQKKRERYGACAATVIHQASQQFGQKLGNLFLKSVKHLLQNQDKKVELEIILINIITEFIRKWPNVAGRLVYDRKGLLVYLLKNVETKTKLDIIKKSQSCLGKLALVMDRQLVNIALNDNTFGLLRFITRNSNQKSGQALKQIRNGLLCLSQLLKSHNIQLRFWAKQTAHLLLNSINSFRSSDDLDNIQIICDILDAALTSLSFVVRTFSRELRDEMNAPRNPYSSFLKELLQFNVQGMMVQAGEQMEVQGYQQDDGYYEQQQADEKCWKVRRGVLYYISFLARYDKQFLQHLKQGQLIRDLGAKLVEQHSMVSQMALNTFNELIELISVDRALTSDELDVQQFSLQRVKSSAKQIADRIIKQLSGRVKIILNNSKFNDQLKSQAAKILLRLIQIYNQHLLANQQQTFKLIGEIRNQLDKTNILDVRVNLLYCLRELISEYYPFKMYSGIYQYCFKVIAKYNNVKTQNVALLTLRKFLDLFYRDIQGQELKRAVGVVCAKVKQLDSDKVIKVTVCKCIGVLLKKYKIHPIDLVVILDSLANKLKIQVQKIYIVDTLGCFSRQQPINKDVIKSIEMVVKQSGQNLGSSNYQLNMKVINTINNLLGIIGKDCSSKLMQDLLLKSKILLGQGRIPSFIKHIAYYQPKLLQQYSQSIVKSTQSQFIVALINSKVIDVNSCLKILRNIQQEKARKVSQTIGAIKLDQRQIVKEVDQSPWGRVMVMALGYVGNDKTLPSLYAYLNKFKSQQAKNDVCCAIGIILSKNPDQLLSNFLGKVGKQIDIYSSLFILKEMLSQTTKDFKSLSFLIQWLFGRSQDKLDSQSSYYIIAQCIGRLAFLSSQATHKIVSNGKSSQPNRRLVVASSLRFSLQNQSININQELMDSYISQVVKLLGDPKVSVREGAIKSLTAVSQNYSKGVRHHARDKKFWSDIMRSARIQDSLITVIDYGLCKEIKDQGKNLRLQSFNLLHSLTKKVHLETFVIQQAMETALHRINDQNSNDIELKRLTLMRSLCELDFSPFIRLQNEFILRVNPKEGLLKKYTKGGEERTQVYLRGILKQIWEINNLAKEENVDKLGELVAQLKNIPLFQPILEQIQNTR